MERIIALPYQITVWPLAVCTGDGGIKRGRKQNYYLRIFLKVKDGKRQRGQKPPEDTLAMEG